MTASGAKFSPSKIDIEMPHIQVLLSTYGGNVYDGLALYDAIKASNTKVDVIISGKAMSMGTIIMLGSETRKAYRNTTFMIHEIASLHFGKLAELENDLGESKRLQKILWDIITSETKITQKQLDDIYEKRKIGIYQQRKHLNLDLLRR